MMPILDGMVLKILYSCLGAWIQDFECHDAKRGIADISVENANYGVFGQALYISQWVLAIGKQFINYTF